MSTQVKFRRGTTAEHSTFAGAAGEMTIDTTKNTLVVHDGSTVGGFPVAAESEMITAQGDISTLNSSMSTAQGDVTALEARSRKNFVINGNFDIWQRATSQTIDGYHSADRWKFIFITNAERSTDTPSGSQYSAKITPIANNQVNLRQNIENGYEFLFGRELTLSFWAKADSARTISTDFNDQAGSLEVHSLTTSWQRFTHTLTLTTTQQNTFVDISSGGTSAVPYYITQVQVEFGDQATDFEHRFGELELCQRYYEKSYTLTTFPGHVGAYRGQEIFKISGLNNVTNGYRQDVRFATGKRINPTIKFYSPVTGIVNKLRDWVTTSDLDTSAIDIGTTGYVWVTNTAAATWLSLTVHWTADCEIDPIG